MRLIPYSNNVVPWSGTEIQQYLVTGFLYDIISHIMTNSVIVALSSVLTPLYIRLSFSLTGMQCHDEERFYGRFWQDNLIIVVRILLIVTSFVSDTLLWWKIFKVRDGVVSHTKDRTGKNQNPVPAAHYPSCNVLLRPSLETSDVILLMILFYILPQTSLSEERLDIVLRLIKVYVLFQTLIVIMLDITSRPFRTLFVQPSDVWYLHFALHLMHMALTQMSPMHLATHRSTLCATFMSRKNKLVLDFLVQIN